MGMASAIPIVLLRIQSDDEPFREVRMMTNLPSSSSPKRHRGIFSYTLSAILIRLLGLAVIDAFALWLIPQMIQDHVWYLLSLFVIITLGINIIFLKEAYYPIRWMSPGLALMLLMVVYPLIFTIYTAFTNYSDGHLLTKQQAIRILSQQLYLPEGGQSYEWIAYRSEDGRFLLWLTSPDGKTLIAMPGKPLQPATPGQGDVAPVDDTGAPPRIDGYKRLDRIQVIRYLPQLEQLSFGAPPEVVKIRSLDEAAPLEPRYVYDPERDAVVDRQTNTIYYADDSRGSFVSEDGEVLTPGYQVFIGMRNFKRLFSSPALRGPFVKVFIWTILFALGTVITTFALGLFLALVYNDPAIRARKLIRSFLILPYAVPSFISILVWRGLMNPHVGVINTTLENLIGWAPPWFSSPTWAKIGVLLVNLWLGYPYMMLISTGALQAIPEDLYEAAEIDGAGLWQRFSKITLPLLLVSVGPLLISSFAFNFNNWNVIYLFNKGGPPMPNTPTPVGHTDILVTYTYRLAFASGGGGDYGYASAITIIIFLIVATITFFQFRYTRMWEEISENV